MADIVNFLLKFMYLAIYQYIAKNNLSTKLSTNSLQTFYKLSTYFLVKLHGYGIYRVFMYLVMHTLVTGESWSIVSGIENSLENLVFCLRER